MNLTIYHNPKCSKSRKTLELVEERGITPRIVAYLETPPSAATILELAAALDCPVRQLLRTGEDDYRAAIHKLDASDDEALAAWLANHPRVLERPIVVDTDSGRAVIGRPPENVLQLVAP